MIILNALNICTIFTTILSGISLSSIIVASCLWKPAYLKSKNELEILLENKPYHLNYLNYNFYDNSDNEEDKTEEDETDNKEDETEEDEEKNQKLKFNKLLINKSIYEKTPDGYIIMNWDQDNNGFQYWSDNNITYKTLEVVARKYVLTFDCIELYIDKYYESQKKYNKLKKLIAKNIKKEKEEKENSTINKNKDTNTNANIFITSKSEKKVKTEITKKDLICEKANKYLKKGKINEFKFTIKKKAQIKNISFLDWETIKLSMGC